MTQWLLVVESWKSHHKCLARSASHPSLTLTQVAHSLQWLSHHRDGWRSQLLINSTQWRHAGIESQSLDDSIKSEPDRPFLGLRTRSVGADLVPRQCRNRSPRESGRIIYIFIIVWAAMWGFPTVVRSRAVMEGRRTLANCYCRYRTASSRTRLETSSVFIALIYQL